MVPVLSMLCVPIVEPCIFLHMTFVSVGVLGCVAMLSADGLGLPNLNEVLPHF